MKFLLATLSLLTSLSSYADRNVLNGGGLAEMQAIYFYQNLHRYLNFCLHQGNQCSLGPLERRELQMISQLSQNARFEGVEILTKLSEQEVFQTEKRAGAKVSLSSSALYQGTSVRLPRPAHDIAGIVLGAYWYQVSELSREEALEKSFALSKMFEQEMTSFSVSEQPLVLIHQMSFQFGDLTEMLFLLEDEQKTIDMTDEIVEQISCSHERPKFFFENWRRGYFQGSQNQLFLIADVTTLCGEEKKYHQFLLNLQLDLKGDIMEKTLNSRLRETF